MTTGRNPVRWFEVYVQDMDRARRFYETVFDVRLERVDAGDLEMMWAFPMALDQAGSGGALVKTAGVDSGGNSTLVYFDCDDCSVEASRVEAAGGKIRRGKMSIGIHGYIVLAVDTEGNLIGLYSMK